MNLGQRATHVSAAIVLCDEHCITTKEDIVPICGDLHFTPYDYAFLSVENM